MAYLKKNIGYHDDQLIDHSKPVSSNGHSSFIHMEVALVEETSGSLPL